MHANLIIILMRKIKVTSNIKCSLSNHVGKGGELEGSKSITVVCAPERRAHDLCKENPSSHLLVLPSPSIPPTKSPITQFTLAGNSLTTREHDTTTSSNEYSQTVRLQKKSLCIEQNSGKYQHTEHSNYHYVHVYVSIVDLNTWLCCMYMYMYMHIKALVCIVQQSLHAHVHVRTWHMLTLYNTIFS